MTDVAFAARFDVRGPKHEGEQLRFEAVAAAQGLVSHSLTGGGTIAVPRDTAATASGAIVGRVFAVGSSRPMDPALAAEAMGAMGPAAFAQAFWGDYVALGAARDRPGSSVVRSPFGNLPCYWSRQESQIFVASSLALLEAFGAPAPSVDWQETACFLLATEMRRGSTCLAGVRELPGGSALRIESGTVAVAEFWSPWAFAGAERRLFDPDDAADAVRAAVDLAVAGHSAGMGASVLLLSGGIDSSVVAAALAAAGRDFAALNMVTRQRSGDERGYAREVAAATGAPLAECPRSLDDLDWDDRTPRKLVRPSARLFRQPTMAAARRLAEARGAAIVFDGGGGDNLFCSLQSVAPLLDRIAIDGLGTGAGATAREIALLADVSLAAIMRKVIARWLQGRVHFRWPIEASFLSPAARTLAGRAAEHPWLDPPPGTLPGAAAHVALVLGALALAEDDSTHEAFRTVSPLVAQPVAETVLRVPSWLWLEQGRNRAIVRRAFRDRLPRSVVERHGKGTPAGFMAEIAFAHRSRIRDMLCEGLLAANGVVDAPAVASYFKEVDHPRDFRFARIMQLVDAERWARLRS